LGECKSLGPVRFVVVGEGAILETLGSFDNLRFADTPKGRLATLSTESPLFECHVRLSKIEEAAQVVVEKNGKTLRVIRFNGAGAGAGAAEGATTTHLSAILHGTHASGLEAFSALQTKYGAKVHFTKP